MIWEMLDHKVQMLHISQGKELDQTLPYDCCMLEISLIKSDIHKFDKSISPSFN